MSSGITGRFPCNLRRRHEDRNSHSPRPHRERRKANREEMNFILALCSSLQPGDSKNHSSCPSLPRCPSAPQPRLGDALDSALGFERGEMSVEAAQQFL